MSHQSDWSYYKRPIKLPLVKVNHVCGDFIPILERSSLFLFKQKQVFLYWPYSDISVSPFTMVEHRSLSWDGFQESSEFVNQPKNHILWHTTCHQGFALREISNVMKLCEF